MGEAEPLMLVEARERAAGLAGQLQAMQEQNAALLAAIKPQAEPRPKKTPPANASHR